MAAPLFVHEGVYPALVHGETSTLLLGQWSSSGPALGKGSVPKAAHGVTLSEVKSQCSGLNLVTSCLIACGFGRYQPRR